MRFILFLLLLSSTTLFSQNTGRKVYFLNSNIFKPTDELVVIVDGPQSKFAEELGSRIYRDSNVIKKICSTFYEQIENDSIYEDVQYYCGHDLFFYLKRDKNIRLIRVLNSDCEYDQIGGKENLNLLKLGEKLIIDTLKECLKKKTKNRIFENTICVKKIEENEKYFSDLAWCDFSTGDKFPRWYYDGKLIIELEITKEKKIKQAVYEFIKELGINEIHNSEINWCGSEDYSKGIVTIYMKKELFHYFDNYDLIEYKNKDYKQFFEDKKYSYLLFKTP
ncbi:MAG: hypothetical protein ACK46Y_01285 [Fluviicola sp.]